MGTQVSTGETLADLTEVSSRRNRARTILSHLLIPATSTLSSSSSCLDPLQSSTPTFSLRHASQAPPY